MNVFGYFYYKFSRSYKKAGEEDYYWTSVLILSLCQTFNAMSLLLFAVRININNWIFCAIGAFTMVINFTCFLPKRKREQYERRWITEKGAKKMIGTIAAISYIVISFVGYMASLFCFMEGMKYTAWVWDLNWSWR